MEDPINKEVDKLYDSVSLRMMKTAEEAFECGVTRLQEIKNYARQAGIKRIGIANCISFSKEALAVKHYLSGEFEVFDINCKCGGITRREMLESERGGIMCNPAGQAAFLKENETELNISMGLCVGHDMIFNQKSSVPVTVLVVKDLANRENPMENINSLKNAAIGSDRT